VACRYARTAIVVEPDIAAADKAVAAEYQTALWLPDNKLATRRIHGVKLIYVAVFACAASGKAKSDLTQTSDLTHGIGRTLRINNIDLVAGLVCVTEKALVSQFGLDQIRIYRIDYSLVHRLVYDNVLLIVSNSFFRS
jgi:hypothetical protein